MKQYLEIIRILAIGLVIFNHLPGYYAYMLPHPKFLEFGYIAITMITRINVPLFLMISGVTLLGKKDSLQKQFSRIFRILALMIVLSLLMYTLIILQNGGAEGFWIKNYIYDFLSGKIAYLGSYWFLYAYLGFLVSLPLVQYIAANLEQKDFYVILGAKVFFTSLIPVINFVLMLNEKTPIAISGNLQIAFIGLKELFYPLMGYYLANKKQDKKEICVWGIVALIGLIIAETLTYIQGQVGGVYTQDYVQLFDYLLAIFVFSFLRYVVERKIEPYNFKICKTVSKFGGCAFGIYLFDPFFKLCFGDKIIDYLCEYMPDVIGSIIWVVISMCIGGIITNILKKNRILSRLI